MTVASPRPPQEVDVLIVGGGAAGLTASLLLSRLGVQSLLVERHPGCSHLPKAHILNQRTMEIFRELGVADDVYKRGAPRANMSTVAWSTSLAGPRSEHGRLIGRVDAWGGGADAAAYDQASPCASTNLPQLRLEPVLRQHAESLALDRVLFQHEVVELTQDADAVTATVARLVDGTRHTVRARYLIGADAGRFVGPTTGIQLGGLTDVVDMVSAHISADLSAYIDDPSVVIHFFVNPDGSGSLGSGVLIKMGPEHWDQHSEEWAFHALVPPGAAVQYEDDFMPDLIRRSLGIPDLPLTVHRTSHWRQEATLADRYRVGRVFVVGDAAHRHFPTTALGLNSAVQDVHNLAWKLAAVLSGHAGESLIDTYEQERRPVARRNVEQATTAALAHPNIDAAIGLAPGMPPEQAWARFTELFSGTQETAALRERVAEAIAHERHEVRAHNIEIGYSYTSSAVLHDGSAPHVYADPVLDFHPQTRPGHRVPHAWLSRGDRQRSVYDLTGRGRFVLIVDAAAPAGSAWAEAAADAADRLGVPLDVLRIGGADSADDEAWADVTGAWAAQREIAPEGAVLVRPDQHVGWRSMGAHPAPGPVLEKALRYILGRPSETATA
ncbi:FAD-dependent monooxygenase [Streptomyces sp. NPDC096132]|uniref:FAD-dependent monooxygenase n=1 Tax=Streptomyces sp. NPDC096132 TaxID=3366075 RepID=UPI0037F9DFCC